MAFRVITKDGNQLQGIDHVYLNKSMLGIQSDGEILNGSYNVEIKKKDGTDNVIQIFPGYLILGGIEVINPTLQEFTLDKINDPGQKNVYIRLKMPEETVEFLVLPSTTPVSGLNDWTSPNTTESTIKIGTFFLNYVTGIESIVAEKPHLHRELLYNLKNAVPMGGIQMPVDITMFKVNNGTNFALTGVYPQKIPLTLKTGSFAVSAGGNFFALKEGMVHEIELDLGLVSGSANFSIYKNGTINAMDSINIVGVNGNTGFGKIDLTNEASGQSYSLVCIWNDPGISIEASTGKIIIRSYKVNKLENM